MGILSEAESIIAGNRYIITSSTNEGLIIKSMAQLILLHEQISELTSSKADAVRSEIKDLLMTANEVIGSDFDWAENLEDPGAEQQKDEGWSWLNTMRDNPVPVFASALAAASAYALVATAW